MTTPRLFTVRQIAERCDLPIRWVKDEAQSGRLPSLRVGRHLLFELRAVRKALARRAARGEGVRHG